MANHHDRPHGEDQRAVAECPFGRHRHHLTAAHIHHLHLDAGAEEEINPRACGDRQQTAQYDGAVVAQQAREQIGSHRGPVLIDDAFVTEMNMGELTVGTP
jgi:hypothetical protein